MKNDNYTNTKEPYKRFGKYYACLKFKDGRTEKKPFDDRYEARKYLFKTYNPKIHTGYWTE